MNVLVVEDIENLGNTSLVNQNHVLPFPPTANTLIFPDSNIHIRCTGRIKKGKQVEVLKQVVFNINGTTLNSARSTISAAKNISVVSDGIHPAVSVTVS